jgi:hypothetical protein
VSVEELLSHPLLWRGQDEASGAAALATGFDALDRYLPGGGWPLAGISEIFVEHYGLGELSLLMPALAELSNLAAENKQWIVWVAPPFVPYAPALARHGVDLSRILLVHPYAGAVGRKGHGHDAHKSHGHEADALWAVEQAIRSQSSIAALAWIKQADMSALRRLQLAAETHRCWTVLFRPITAISDSSPAALRLKLSPVLNREKAVGARLDIQKCRGRRPCSLVI